MAMLQDKICKVCQTPLEWKGSVMEGKMVCPNSYCSTNKTAVVVTIRQVRETCEGLEYDAADD